MKWWHCDHLYLGVVLLCHQVQIDYSQITLEGSLANHSATIAFREVTETFSQSFTFTVQPFFSILLFPHPLTLGMLVFLYLGQLTLTSHSWECLLELVSSCNAGMFQAGLIELCWLVEVWDMFQKTSISGVLQCDVKLDYKIYMIPRLSTDPYTSALVSSQKEIGVGAKKS